MQLVVPNAVRNAVSAATITFNASSIIRCLFIIMPEEVNIIYQSLGRP